MASNEDRTRVYAALILQDDEVAITSDKISTPLKAAKVYFEPCWPDLFAKALDGVDVKNMIISLSSGTGSGGPAADPRIRKLSPVQVLHAFKESSSSRIHHHGQALLFIFIAYTLFNDTKWSSSSSTSTPSRSQVLRRRLHRLHDAQLHDKESTKSKPSFPRHVLYFPFPFLIFTTFRVAILVPTFPFHVYSFLSPVPPFRCIPLASACPYKTMEREKVHGPPQGLDTTRNGCETTTTTRIGCEGRMRQESPRRALQVKPHDEAKLVKYVLYEGRMSARRSTSLHQANETRPQARPPPKSDRLQVRLREGRMLFQRRGRRLFRGVPSWVEPLLPFPRAPVRTSTRRYRRRRHGARPRIAGRPKKRALFRASRGFLGDPVPRCRPFSPLTFPSPSSPPHPLDFPPLNSHSP